MEAVRKLTSHLNYKIKLKTNAHRVLGGFCASCGASEGLEIDHLKPSYKELIQTLIGKKLAKNGQRRYHEIRLLLNKGYRPEEFFQLLCGTCHNLKTDKNKDWNNFSKESNLFKSNQMDFFE
jgi:hypothetical protein